MSVFLSVVLSKQCCCWLVYNLLFIYVLTHPRICGCHQCFWRIIMQSCSLIFCKHTWMSQTNSCVESCKLFGIKGQEIKLFWNRVVLRWIRSVSLWLLHEVTCQQNRSRCNTLVVCCSVIEINDELVSKIRSCQVVTVELCWTYWSEVSKWVRLNRD